MTTDNVTSSSSSSYLEKKNIASQSPLSDNNNNNNNNNKSRMNDIRNHTQGVDSTATNNNSSNNNNGSTFFSFIPSTLMPTTSFLLLWTSIPIVGGAYMGYQREVRKRKHRKFLTAAATKKIVTAQPTHNVNGALLAGKALGIGSLLSIGGFGLLCSAVLYGSGCDSVEELMQTWRVWTPRKRKELLRSLGLLNEQGESRMKKISHLHQEDIIDTQNMNEDEEWDYMKTKYFHEFIFTDEEDNNNDTTKNTTNKNDNGKGDN